MTPIQLGPATITRIVELPRSSWPTAAMLPESTPEAIAAHHHWLAPTFVDPATGDLAAHIQTYVVTTPQRTVVVDTGVGNAKVRHGAPAWHLRQGAWLDDLQALGVTPEQVDLVVCTHLHTDHVGWNTRQVDGRWKPTFPNATYLFVGDEWEFWKRENAGGREESGCIADSVEPVVAAGQVKLVEDDHVVDERLAFEPAPGHTPGHVCLRLSTPEGDALFAGDLMHRTVQVAEPRWNSRFCHDGPRARATREAFVERYADSGVLIIPAHFPCPGFIVRDGGGYRFQARAA